MTATSTIVKAADTVAQSLKMVVYGNSGVGKTTFASTAPKPIILSAEAGLLSIADKDIDVISIDKWTDLHDAFDYLKNAKHDYKTVVLDSLTELQKKHQDHLVGASEKQMTQQQWGINIEVLRKTCRAFRDLPMNVILIALASEIEQNGVSVTRIALQGKSLPNEVMGFVDLVGHMVTQERVVEDSEEMKIVRAIRFQPTDTIAAKDRSDRLEIWEKPDFTKIYNKVFPEKKEKK
ncbi:hypothetical protein LCGC14_1414500 [marine sediment metagenome]|uniref:Uncharacterized protein n=1 Tax=marine sediment metagenome TaxID=412755 RepID=A0A0F9KEC5_9ZZZZ